MVGLLDQGAAVGGERRETGVGLRLGPFVRLLGVGVAEGAGGVGGRAATRTAVAVPQPLRGGLI